MTGFRGHSQSAGSPVAKGPMGQRELVQVLRVLIDTSKSQASSRTRDDARKALRELLKEANWHTPYVLRNLGARRCRYLAGLGYSVPIEDMTRSGIDRLNQWAERNGK